MYSLLLYVTLDRLLFFVLFFLIYQRRTTLDRIASYCISFRLTLILLHYAHFMHPRHADDSLFCIVLISLTMMSLVLCSYYYIHRHRHHYHHHHHHRDFFRPHDNLILLLSNCFCLPRVAAIFDPWSVDRTSMRYTVAASPPNQSALHFNQIRLLFTSACTSENTDTRTGNC